MKIEGKTKCINEEKIRENRQDGKMTTSFGFNGNRLYILKSDC